MQATVMIQVHPNGQTNVCFTDDPTVDPHDLLVTGGGWADARVVKGKVLILGDDPEILEHLLQTEFRSVDNSADIEPSREVPESQVLSLHTLIQEAYK